jgi:phage terminase small subunit
MSLQYRQILFVNYYLNDAKNDAAKAAEMAGYAKPHVAGNSLLNNPRIKAYLLQKLKEAGVMPPEEVLARLTTIAAFDPTEFLEFTTEENRAGNEVERASFDVKKLKRKRLGYVIKKLKVQPSGQVEVEFHDGVDALDKIAKYHGMFKPQSIDVMVHNDSSTNDRIVAILGEYLNLSGSPVVRTIDITPEPGGLCDRGEQREVEGGQAPPTDQPTPALGGPACDRSSGDHPRSEDGEV